MKIFFWLLVILVVVQAIIPMVFGGGGNKNKKQPKPTASTCRCIGCMEKLKSIQPPVSASVEDTTEKPSSKTLAEMTHAVIELARAYNDLYLDDSTRSEATPLETGKPDCKNEKNPTHEEHNTEEASPTLPFEHFVQDLSNLVRTGSVDIQYDWAQDDSVWAGLYKSESTESEQPMLEDFVQNLSNLVRTGSVETQFDSAQGDSVWAGSDKSEPTTPHAHQSKTLAEMTHAVIELAESYSDLENEKKSTHLEHNTGKASTSQLEQDICGNCGRKRRNALKKAQQKNNQNNQK